MLAKTARTYNKPRQSYKGLTPTQTKQAKDFLSAILYASVIAKGAGVQMDVGKCITAYRG